VPQHLVTGQFDHRQLRKLSHGLAVAAHKRQNGILTAKFAGTGFAPRKHNTRRHAFHVPLPWSGYGLVKVVDIEYDSPVGSGERTHVVHVCVPAKLSSQAGIRRQGKIFCHHRGSTAVVGEGRNRHALVLFRQEVRHPTPLRLVQQLNR